MTTFLAAALLTFLVLAIGALLERNHHRVDGVPHLPLGADADHDADLWRVRHDLEVGPINCSC